VWESEERWRFETLSRNAGLETFETCRGEILKLLEIALKRERTQE
jgi:hypothetical protein